MEKIENYKDSIIYNTIISERDNIISDTNRIYLHFDVGKRLNSSGYVMDNNEMNHLKEEYSKINDNLKSQLIKTRNQKDRTSISKMIHIDKHDLDISRIQKALAKAITSKEELKKMNPDEKFQEHILSRSEKIRRYRN